MWLGCFEYLVALVANMGVSLLWVLWVIIYHVNVAVAFFIWPGCFGCIAAFGQVAFGALFCALLVLLVPCVLSCSG